MEIFFFCRNAISDNNVLTAFVNIKEKKLYSLLLRRGNGGRRSRLRDPDGETGGGVSRIGMRNVENTIVSFFARNLHTHTNTHKYTHTHGRNTHYIFMNRYDRRFGPLNEMSNLFRARVKIERAPFKSKADDTKADVVVELDKGTYARSSSRSGKQKFSRI